MDGGRRQQDGAASADSPDGDAAAAIAAPGGVLRARLLAARGDVPAPAAAPAPLPPAPPPSVERGVAMASARAAARAGGLPATAEAVSGSAITLAELTEVLPEGALIAVIEGAAERLGVVALCPSMIASLIEMQAMGRVSGRPTAARRATRTDAAIAAEFVNALLEEVGNALAATPLGTALAGFRYASYLDDPRPLGLMLEDGGFHALSVTLRLGLGGERTGRVFLAVPGVATPTAAKAFDAGAAAPASAPPAAGTALDPADAPPRRTLARAVADAPVALSAILCRRSITLRELRALRPGAMLSLPRGALEAVQVETLSGQPLGTGRLGEADGLYAVRMTDPSATEADHSPALTDDDAASFRPSDALPAFDAPAFAIPPFASALDEATAAVSFDGVAGPPMFAPSFEPPIADIGAPDGFRPTPDLAFDISFAAQPMAAQDDAPDGAEPLPMSFIIS